MREERLQFKQCGNAFLRCSAPERLQQIADSLDPSDLVTCGQKWLAQLTPFFTAKERAEAGCQHRLFFSQIEFCDNLIFNRRPELVGGFWLLLRTDGGAAGRVEKLGGANAAADDHHGGGVDREILWRQLHPLGPDQSLAAQRPILDLGLGLAPVP